MPVTCSDKSSLWILDGGGGVLLHEWKALCGVSDDVTGSRGHGEPSKSYVAAGAVVVIVIIQASSLSVSSLSASSLSASL